MIEIDVYGLLYRLLVFWWMWCVDEGERKSNFHGSAIISLYRYVFFSSSVLSVKRRK